MRHTNNLMQALNVEDNTEGLRYAKVILATDADVDGLHIRNLMITYFFRFFKRPRYCGQTFNNELSGHGRWKDCSALEVEC